MSIGKISRTDTVFANNVFLPAQTYRVCCTKSELGKSRKGNPMITLTAEIIEPEVIENDGKEVRITGQTFQIWLTLVPWLVGKQRESNMAQVWKFCDKVGVTDMCELNPESGAPDFDAERHEEYFKGLEWDMPLSSVPRTKRMKQTPEQKAKGEPGTPILDGEGNEIQDGWDIEARLEDTPPDPRPSRRESVAEPKF